METVLYMIIGVACGFSVAWFLMKSRGEKMLAEAKEQFGNERLTLSGELSVARQETAIAENQLEAERKVAEERLSAERKAAEERLAAEQRQSAQLREEMQKQHEAKNKLLQEELRNLTAQMLSESKAELNKENKDRLDTLLTPLKERMEAFQRAVNENSKEGAQNKTEIKSVFEEAMKKLHDEQESTIQRMKDNHESTVRQMKEDQERTVRELKEQTGRIADDAAALTLALKGDSKMQGDWGEMILDKTLEDCGLIKDEQYFLQPTYKDEFGNTFRPDAVIEFPNKERAVVDSKVSLTAYQEAVRSDDDEERARLLRQHVTSMRQHVDELSDKSYEKLVPGCIGYVLMFVPYESGYSAAVKTDASLLQYAYKKHIIILSPSNLLMALQLTHTMWQNYRMNKNVEEILRQSNDLYDKFVTFAETFVKMETDITRLHDDFDKAKSQLREGKGNIIRRLDNMKSLGITPKKQIPEGLM